MSEFIRERLPLESDSDVTERAMIFMRDLVNRCPSKLLTLRSGIDSGSGVAALEEHLEELLRLQSKEIAEQIAHFLFLECYADGRDFQAEEDRS